MDIVIDTTTSGPLLAGRAPAIVEAILNDARQELADVAVKDVRQTIHQHAIKATGHYEGQIVTDEIGGETVVWDRGVIYGEWLEGVANRNRNTRFKGYQAFRKAKQELQRKAPKLLEEILRRTLGRLE